jgi:hypothetical protein
MWVTIESMQARDVKGNAELTIFVTLPNYTNYK